MHADVAGINTNVDTRSAAEKIRALNHPENLERIFFGDGANVLYTTQVDSGSRISIVVPSAPYSDESLMVVAAGPASFGSETVETETVYDYPDDAQFAYWGFILDTLRALKDLPELEGGSTVIATENCMATVSNEEHRTSRSIALPHSQIFRVDHSKIQPGRSTIDHLTQEQRILSSGQAVGRFTEHLDSFLREHLPESLNPRLSPRTHEPFGYQLLLGVNKETEDVADVLFAHHFAYSRAIEGMLKKLNERSKRKIKPQPSYRLYLTYSDDDELTAIVSPQIVSHAGVVEAAGIDLDRSPTHPKGTTPDQMDSFYAGVMAEVLAKEQEVAISTMFAETYSVKR